MFHLTFAALATLLLLVDVPVIQAQTIKQLSFVHRHGARDEPLVIDGNLVWDYAQLTPNGETMMLNLGKLLRSVYGEFISSFDPNVYEALSGDSDRCIQSAHGILRTFFNESSEFMPIIKHVPLEGDWLMEFNYNFPNVIARSNWYYAYQNNDTLARILLSNDDINLLSNEFGSWCTQTPMLCALFAADAIQCRISNTLNTSENLRNLFLNKLLPIQYGDEKHMYGFYPNDPYAVIGSPAYTLVSKILNDAKTENKKVYHYSAHDTTLLGVLNTIGSILTNDTDPKWFPRFGAIIAITTFTNGNISFSYAEPEQDANSSLDYISGLPSLTVRCQNAAGTEYISTQCPLEDIWRYVNRSKPSVENPFCFLRPEDKCDVLDEIPSANCQYYRKHCPSNVCGNNAVLDAANNYMCASITVKEKMQHYALAASLSGVIGAVAGLIIGVFIAFLLIRVEAKEERRRLVLRSNTA